MRKFQIAVQDPFRPTERIRVPASWPEDKVTRVTNVGRLDEKDVKEEIKKEAPKPKPTPDRSLTTRRDLLSASVFCTRTVLKKAIESNRSPEFIEHQRKKLDRHQRELYEFVLSSPQYLFRSKTIRGAEEFLSNQERAK